MMEISRISDCIMHIIEKLMVKAFVVLGKRNES